MTAPRVLVAATIVAALASCGEADHYIAPVPVVETPSPAAAAAPGGQATPATHAFPRPTPATYGGGSPAAGIRPGGDPDFGAVGDLARGLLRPDPYSNIALEIDVAGNAEPGRVTRDYVKQVLKQATVKAVNESGGHAFAGVGGGCWKSQDIFAVAGREARTHTGGSTVALRILFLDGSVCQGAGILGMAFRAGTVAIFTGQVTALATPTVGADVFLKAVTTHEVGHILGLVNIGYKSAQNHEDPQHAGHSSNKSSVMYYAIDQSNLIQQFVGGPPTTFDGDDQADLQGLRDGYY